MINRFRIPSPFAGLNEWTHTPTGQAFADGLFMGMILASAAVIAVYELGVNLCLDI
jgi:hypothetical protein